MQLLKSRMIATNGEHWTWGVSHYFVSCRAFQMCGCTETSTRVPDAKNDQVRVIRARYGPHEKGVMHEHSFNLLVTFLTDCKMKVTPPEGESRTATKVAGDVVWGGPSKHIEENLNDKPLEVLVVEFKK